MQKLPASVIEKIQRNYDGGGLSARAIIELLQEKVSPGAARAVNELVRRMSQHRYFILRAHNKGSKDKTVHITIYINNHGHHLRLDGRGVVFQVTDSHGNDLGSVPPWVPPGA